MERRQGFFAVLREEVARGLSPARARRKSDAAHPDAGRRFSTGVGGGGGQVLAPLVEGPDPESGDGECDGGGGGGGGRAKREGWVQWVHDQLSCTPSSVAAMVPGAGVARNDLRLLLGVMGAPLGPVHVCAAEPLPHLVFLGVPTKSFR